jgi:hypothetical protein
MKDKQTIKKYKNLTEAITHQFADKKYCGVIGVFMKYLVEKESLLSYGGEASL